MSIDAWIFVGSSIQIAIQANEWRRWMELSKNEVGSGGGGQGSSE